MDRRITTNVHSLATLEETGRRVSRSAGNSPLHHEPVFPGRGHQLFEQSALPALLEEANSGKLPAIIDEVQGDAVGDASVFHRLLDSSPEAASFSNSLLPLVREALRARAEASAGLLDEVPGRLVLETIVSALTPIEIQAAHNLLTSAISSEIQVVGLLNLIRFTGLPYAKVISTLLIQLTKVLSGANLSEMAFVRDSFEPTEIDFAERKPTPEILEKLEKAKDDIVGSVQEKFDEEAATATNNIRTAVDGGGTVTAVTATEMLTHIGTPTLVGGSMAVGGALRGALGNIDSTTAKAILRALKHARP